MSETAIMQGPAADAAALSVGGARRLASGWWGMWGLIFSEAALFAYLLFSYFYVGSHATNPWPEGGIPKLMLSTINTAILLASSAAAWWGERGLRAGRVRQLNQGLAAALLLGCVFVGIQLQEWHSKTFSLTSDAYGSLYFTITGFHMAHVAAGLFALALLLVWGLRGYFGRTRRSYVAIGVVYWHFVDAVWIAVYATIYLSPRLL